MEEPTTTMLLNDKSIAWLLKTGQGSPTGNRPSPSELPFMADFLERLRYRPISGNDSGNPPKFIPPASQPCVRRGDPYYFYGIMALWDWYTPIVAESQVGWLFEGLAWVREWRRGAARSDLAISLHRTQILAEFFRNVGFKKSSCKALHPTRGAHNYFFLHRSEKFLFCFFNKNLLKGLFFFFFS